MTLMLQENKQTNVIGPISPEDWQELVNLRRTIKFMKDTGDENFYDAIERYSNFYDELWLKYFPKAA